MEKMRQIFNKVSVQLRNDVTWQNNGKPERRKKSDARIKKAKILKTSLAYYFLYGYFYAKRDLCLASLHFLIVVSGTHRRRARMAREHFMRHFAFFAIYCHIKKTIAKRTQKNLLSIAIFDTFIIHPRNAIYRKCNRIQILYDNTKKAMEKYVKYFISSKIVSAVIYLSDHDGCFACEYVHRRREQKTNHQSILQRITYQMHTYASSVFCFYFTVDGAPPSQMRLRRMKNVPFTHATCLFVDYRHDNDMP